MRGPFDLNRFAGPEDVRFRLRKHGDHLFVVDADPDVDDVARMLRIENVIRGREEDADVEAALVEGKQMLLRMIRERDPDFGELRIGSQELIVVFSLIVHGDTVAAAVLEAITAANSRAAGGTDSPDRDADQVDADVDREEDETPLLSERRSSERSSTSDELEVGLPVTGMA